MVPITPAANRAATVDLNTAAGRRVRAGVSRALTDSRVAESSRVQAEASTVQAVLCHPAALLQAMSSALVNLAMSAWPLVQAVIWREYLHICVTR